MRPLGSSLKVKSGHGAQVVLVSSVQCQRTWFPEWTHVICLLFLDEQYLTFERFEPFIIHIKPLIINTIIHIFIYLNQTNVLWKNKED